MEGHSALAFELPWKSSFFFSGAQPFRRQSYESTGNTTPDIPDLELHIESLLCDGAAASLPALLSMLVMLPFLFMPRRNIPMLDMLLDSLLLDEVKDSSIEFCVALDAFTLDDSLVELPLRDDLLGDARP